MIKIHILLTLLATVIGTVHCDLWHPGPPSCECFDPVYIPRPKQFGECYYSFYYYIQILKNFVNVDMALLINGSPYFCNFDLYKERVNVMKQKTIDMVDAYFSCTEVDCTPAIWAAYKKYTDYRNKEFTPATQCSFTKYNSDCAQVLIRARPSVYNSGENVLLNMLTCAKLKSETPPGTMPTFSPLPNYEENQCNCVTADERPIPKDESECFSTKYIATLRNFVEVGFARIYDVYNMSNVSCDITPLYEYIEKFKRIALSVMQLLEEANPQMADLDEYFEEFLEVISGYSPVLREILLSPDASCYTTPRNARQPPVNIADAVIGVVMKCITLRNPSQNKCTRFLE